VIRAAHCKVSGVIGGEIRFTLLLPDEWNGKFIMGGGGGFVGTVANSAQTTVNQGYATAGTDTGHQGDGLDANWSAPCSTTNRSRRMTRTLATSSACSCCAGVLHCGGGPGPDTVDWVSAITDWVEGGKAPDRLVASKRGDGALSRTRPLCPYPKHAEYAGNGSPDDEKSFSCR
jgi:Tannase and feruloyl esterase